jgi:hypothetical protein
MRHRAVSEHGSGGQSAEVQGGGARKGPAFERSNPAAPHMATGSPKRRYLMTKGAVILAGLLFVLSGGSEGAEAQSEAGWLDLAWSYRSSAAITNTSGTNLTDFQVQVILPGSFDFSKAMSNGADLRVTDSDGTTQLPFWIESWNAQNALASIWVRVPSIPTSGWTIYLYYGNPAATGASSGDATFQFFDDFSYVSSVTSVVNNAVSWLMRAQDANSPGGVSYYYSVASQAWSTQEYPEVTGYIIPTFYDAANATTDTTLAADLRSRAQQMADWEVSIQGTKGSWQYVFDTGQVIEGLVRAYQETSNLQYLNAAIRAGDWLVSVQSPDGSWPNKDAGSFAHSYHARVSRNLLLLWQATGTAAYYDAAVSNLNWVVSQQQPNGWFANDGIDFPSENDSPLTHTIAYTMEGLLDSGVILNNPTYINAAQLTANALLGLQTTSGSLSGGSYYSDWTPATTSQCLTGSAQTALVWLKLYKYTLNQGAPDSRYLNAAVKMNQYLVRVQGNSSNPGINGGLAGSDPVGGSYKPDLVLAWAAKFFVDDLNLEAQFFPSGTLQFSVIDPGKWSFPTAMAGFSNAGSVLQYNGASAGPGPRALAMQNSANLVFSDGIVEYNLMSNGGYDELGLMYRGQNPETANSYVFYPSIWNSQNDWLLYRKESSKEGYIASGGLFIPGVWYAVKAAIGGSSHTFSINGAQVFTAADSTFASGSVGLFAWGNTVSWVTNFRIRQYAATEPSATVGPAQTSGPGVASLVLSPTSVVGGDSATGTVTLNTTAGGTVTLTSSNTSVAMVPASVTVPADSTTANFTVGTSEVATLTNVTITATYNETSQTATLAVMPLLSSLGLNPTSVVGGNSSQGTVMLAVAAPAGGVTVGLTSGNTSVATVPASVLVAAGATSATFDVSTASVTATSPVTITATYSGASQTATLTVTPGLASLALNPGSVTGGLSSQGTVSLTGAAPSGGAVVSLTSSNTSVATVPASVLVAAGAASATFTVSTTTVSTSTAVTISASYGGSVQTATLTLLPGGGSWINSAWQYRAPVTISNPGGTVLSNYQVNVVLNSSFPFVSAKADGSDVRFTATDGVTLLPYWIESWNPSQGTASLWVQVPSIPVSGTTIYLYYGNSAATTASNGNATFNFFDDFSYTSSGSPAIDPSKWSFPAGITGFSNAGNVLQYNGVSAGFGPRALAIQSSATLVFTDGIVEYNLTSNGGYDELGLEYRGQNPETSNSYVFFPTIYSSQNDWLLYRRLSNASVRLGSGGSFAPGVTYKVKAAIGGSSHTFSINGAQVFAATDSTFASGTVGLFAWGSSVSWVTNFRIRQYAATEPTTVVGSQQTAP